MAASARKMLCDLTNRPEALASRAAKPLKAAAGGGGQQPPAAEQPELGQQLEECDAFLRSFRQLSFDPTAAPEQTAAGGAPDDEPAPLEDEDSAISSATADSSRLGSPLAAFAAAKERLARNTRAADGVLEEWRHRGTRPPAPDAATPRAAVQAEPASSASTGMARSSLLARLPPASTAAGQRGLPAGGASTATATELLLQQRRNLLPQHQRQHVLLLRERLAATMQLCHALHEQVGSGAVGRKRQAPWMAYAWSLLAFVLVTLGWSLIV